MPEGSTRPAKRSAPNWAGLALNTSQSLLILPDISQRCSGAAAHGPALQEAADPSRGPGSGGVRCASAPRAGRACSTRVHRAPAAAPQGIVAAG